MGGGLATTSVFLQVASAANAACSLHVFFTTKVNASIRKVNLKKFSLKATVFHDVGGCLLQCTLKVRVFRMPQQVGEGQELVVEFTRRQGDAVAFGHIFRLASEYLQAEVDESQAGMQTAWEVDPPVVSP